MSSLNNKKAGCGVGTKLQAQARAYQIEMFNLSRKQNTIVAMGTGTGKTQIALLRIAEEIRCESSNKLIWFLCPTVALCQQHLASIKMHIPPMCCRSFTGNDNIDHWKTKEIWDAALSSVRVAVSTYQVLFDALSHGFVRMDSLSLLIFDEAHNCTKKSAANRIMERFYFPQKKRVPANIPKILGLSASPVISKPSTLKMIEQSLDSICKSPTHHYSELLEFANLPLSIIERYSGDISQTEPDLLIGLQKLVQLSLDNGMGESEMKPLREFINASKTVDAQLGGWATARYMTASIKDFKKRSRANAEMQLSFTHRTDFVMGILRQLGTLEEESSLTEKNQMSPKCLCLLRTLIRVYSTKFRGIVFAKERSTVFALKDVIEHHAQAATLFRCGAFVGLSNVWGCSRIGDLHSARDQAETLQKFRLGYLNLIITTDALEEGIDVPSCNAVVNFDKPANLKSFIQRRGRARQKDSVFINIVGDAESESSLSQFRKAEQELIEIYQDEGRRQEALERSNEKHNGSYLSFEVERTGAQITMHESVAYLYRFCASLPVQPSSGLIQAVAQLPKSLDPSLHIVSGSKLWSSKRLAKADAALQAYIALFNAQLVNDHLIPSQPEDILGQTLASKSHCSVLAQYSPWADAARLWAEKSALFSHQVRISRPGKSDTRLVMVTPIRIPFETHIPLFVSPCLTYTATISAGKSNSWQNILIGRQVTRLILGSVFRNRLPFNQDDFVNLFVPDVDDTELEPFLSGNTGTRTLSKALEDGVALHSLGLLRDTQNPCLARVIKIPPTPRDAERLMASTSLDWDTYPLPWRLNFLRAFHVEEQTSVDIRRNPNSPNRREPLKSRNFEVDRLPFQYAEAALFLPSITHEIEVYLVAEHLRQQFLNGVSFQRIDLLITAIRPSCTENRNQFESMAFFGDTIIRFILSKQLFLHHPLWHEGLLSKLRDAILSDSGLAKAAVSSGLAKFLVTTKFNGKKWKPAFISNFSTERSAQREIGAASLADMIKAVIGAAHISNGLDDASKCAAAIIPRFKGWHDSSLHDGDYMETRPLDMSFSREWDVMESLLGYSFGDKSLLVEAITHPSYIGPSQTASFGRLSFIGNSVLDMIVVNYLQRQHGYMKTDRMQSLKAAVTNNRILAFFCLDFEIELQQKDVITNDAANIRTTVKRHSLTMRNFLQFHGQELAHQLSESISSIDLCRIRKALQTSQRYPWADLSGFPPCSPLSDVAQSIFGAIYVDSHASIHDCERLAQRMGILPALHGFIERNVVTDHPRKILCALRPKSKITYHILKDHEEAYRCRVSMDGSDVVTVEGSKSRAATVVYAAYVAACHLSKLES
ncbi:uncharacterized protein BDV17DRAFT_283567 [Aspergillus undulatus]|uniref:uncharacterized protein n=1 Tax=Aspergillus undulatus TaxID=1810928 RepID=UPI003CCE0476